MHHLLLGINPVELGGAPFALATDESVRVRARDLNLTLHTKHAMLCFYRASQVMLEQTLQE